MKSCTSFLLFTVLVFPLPALETVFLEPVQPVSPVLKAQGGASTANAEGFDALFINPAAYSVSKTDLTFFLLETTGHVSLSGLNQVLDARQSWSNPLGSTMQNMISSLLKTSGIGEEFSWGAGWVGNNLGLGLLLQERVMAKGPNLLDADAKIDVTVTGVVGMAWPFDVGLGTLRVGGAIRPMQRLISTVSAYDLLLNSQDSGFLNAIPVATGFGLGLDLGVRWDYAGFQTGLVVRDAGGTVLGFKDFTVKDLTTSLGFPSGGDTSGNTIYRIPTVIGFGSSWTPEMGTLSSLFQPSLILDLQIPIKNEFTQSSFWTWTHVGASMKLLNAVSIRTGLNQGYLTFGLGAKLFITEFNFAIFADELGRFSGTSRRPGMSLEWAFRL